MEELAILSTDSNEDFPKGRLTPVGASANSETESGLLELFLTLHLLEAQANQSYILLGFTVIHPVYKCSNKSKNN